MSASHPCVACGFLVFDEPPGSFAICPVCGWEDDNVQAADPHYQGGANGISLVEAQRAVLAKLPIENMVYDGWARDKGWRPISN